jgi:hypothetical protein
MGKIVAGGVAAVTAFVVYAPYDHYSGGDGMPARTYEWAAESLASRSTMGGEASATTAAVGAANGENILSHKGLVASDVAATALRQLQQSGEDGCPDTTDTQILLNPNRATSTVCLDVNGATQAPSSEITFVTYMKQEAVDLSKTLSDPANTAYCRQLTQRLGAFAQSLFHGSTLGKIVPPNQDVAVAIRVDSKTPFPECDAHAIPQNGRL